MKKCFLVIFSIIAFASVAQRINDFNLFFAGNGITVKFTISKGTLCNGYNILHSLDSINFNTIYNFPGVCGNTSNDESISYFHASPEVNKNNYYKIELIPIEVSVIKKIFVFAASDLEAVLYPNPQTGNSDLLDLRIFNAGTIQLKGFIYDQHGSSIQELNLTTSFDLAKINVSNLKNGVYFIRLTGAEKKYSFKLIINR
jgi:hypothetical protein